METQTKNLICIECPRGCALTAKITGTEVTITGNFCAKGKTYGMSEMTRPCRVVTSTVKTAWGEMLPVKTDRPVLKEKIFSVMSQIAQVTVLQRVCIGDTVLLNVDGEGACVVATKNALEDTKI